MKENTFAFPSYTIGSDAYSKVDEICKLYGKKAIVIGGKRAINSAKPYFKRDVKEIEILKYHVFLGEASFEACDEILALKELQEADMIFGVGGGKAIDTAKEVQIKTQKSLFTFPTIASTCAAGTKIAITYYPSGESRETLSMKCPPKHVFINTEIIANAPDMYLWAGIGDTLAKYYEVSFSARNKELDYFNSLAIQLAPLTNKILFDYGYDAYQDIKNKKDTYALSQVILDIIITTAYVSILIDHKYNTALAHAIYYGFTLKEVINEKHLHGEVVSYGLLVQLMMDYKNDSVITLEEIQKVYNFNKSLNLPTCLKDLDLEGIDIKDSITKAKNNSGLEIVPYKITEKMIEDAIQDLEKYNK